PRIVKEGFLLVEGVVGAARGVGLPFVLRHGPGAGLAIDGDRRPARSVFVAEVDQQRVGVVLDAQPVLRIRCLVEAADRLAACADRRWVCLIHGLGYGRWGWEPVVGPLAERFRVVALDNRGIGASDVPEGPYSASQMASDVVAVLGDAGIERTHVVATSLGGMIAQELATADPARVDRLVLVSTTPGGAGSYPMPEGTVRLIAEMPRLPLEESLRRGVVNALSPGALAEQPTLAD